MFKNSLLFGMKETGLDRNMTLLKDESMARKYNYEGFGIFFSINGFKERRVKENLLNINAWAVDIDNLDKNTQKNIIYKAPVPPSLIIESKNGYHVYWFSKDATESHYNEIVGNRLVPFFQADIRAKDICRILRMPSYFHMKDPNDPFLVQEAFRTDIIYTQREMLAVFPSKKQIKENNKKIFAEEYDNVDALLKLSGKPEVNNEIFTFKDNANNTKQIVVNGKLTSSWVDQYGYIGSYDRGGCTWVQWLKWYKHTGQEAMRIGESYGIRKK